MTRIRVGRDASTIYESTLTGVTVKKEEKKEATQAQTSQGMTNEQKQKILDEVFGLPKEKQVEALRKAGLKEEADALEEKYANEHIQELKEQARAERLKEIKEKPEDEQLALLLEEGFEEEAKALSEKMAAEKAEEMAKAAAEASVEAALASTEATNAEQNKEEDTEGVNADDINETTIAKAAKTPKAKAPAKTKDINLRAGKKSKK